MNRILISYQNQVLHQIGQSTVGKHDKTCHRSGNTLSVAIGGARAVAAAVRIVCAAAAAGTAAHAVGSLITLLGLHAAREELPDGMTRERERERVKQVGARCGLSIDTHAHHIQQEITRSTAGAAAQAVATGRGTAAWTASQSSSTEAQEPFE